jgi:hypothetical protein
MNGGSTETGGLTDESVCPTDSASLPFNPG